MLQPESLARYLQTRFPAGSDFAVSGVSRIGMGASRETWSFDATWREEGETRSLPLVLRRDNDVGVVQTDLEFEFQMYRAMQGRGIPIPGVYWYDPDPAWAERPFFLTARIDDCEASPFSLLHDPSWAAARPRLADEFVAILVTLHNLDFRTVGADAFMSVPDPARSSQEQIEYWAHTLDEVELEPQPLLRGILQWLREHVPPPPSRLAIVHGDFRVGNFLATEEGEIRGMLDWEMAHLGDGAEDVGWALFFNNMFRGELLPREDFVRRYSEGTGYALDPERVRFWEVFAGMKLAVIFLTGTRSFADGRSRDTAGLMFAQSAVGSTLQALDAMGERV